MAATVNHLAFTPQVEADTALLWDKVRAHVTPMEWRLQAPLIAEINRLKREKNAVILAHNYMTPEIFHGVGDYRRRQPGPGARGGQVRRAIIVQAGVHFMAETSKVLSPRKARADPRPARRLLAGELDHRRGRAADQAALSGVPVVTYVNTTPR